MQPIFYTAATSGEDAIPSFHPHQVVIGPHLSCGATEGRPSSRNTFPGEFDLGTWSCGKGLDPEAPLTVVIDGNHLGWPVNLAAHAGKKVMMVGHLPKSVVFRRELAAYVADEPFDLVVLTNGPAGSDLFAAASRAPVVMRPGWLSPLRPGGHVLDRANVRREGVACPAATLDDTNTINRVVAKLREQDLQPQFWSSGADGRQALFGHAAVSLIVSEDGDLSVEAWQALAAGSAVVVLDETGNDWAEEMSMVVAHDCAAAVHEVQRMLREPNRGARLRRGATNWYYTNLSFTVRQRGWGRMLERLQDGSILHEVLPRGSLGPEWDWPVAESGHPFLRVSPTNGHTVLLALP